MKSFILRSMENEELESFVHFTNSLDPSQEVNIYISSPGGKVYIADIIYNIISNLDNRIIITIYEASSCCQDLVYKLYGKNNITINVSDDFYSIIHIPYYNIDYCNGKPRNKNTSKYIRSNSSFNYILSGEDFLTKEQRTEYENGEDVFIDKNTFIKNMKLYYKLTRKKGSD